MPAAPAAGPRPSTLDLRHGPQVFFITGLPRSRTAWLANLFTHGPCFCFHDLTAECERISQFANHFTDLARTREDLTHIGVSDSGLALFAVPLLELFPAAKWIIIRRDRAAAQASFSRFYQSAISNQQSTINNQFRSLQAALNTLLETLPPLQLRTVDYAALEHQETARDLWDFVLSSSALRAPRSSFDSDRWHLLDKLRINTAADKRELNLARGAQLLEESVWAHG